MEDIIRVVSEKTGLPADKAKAAADSVINYLKDKLPGPVASQIDSIVKGGGGTFDNLSSGMKTILK
jgi:hypothetical protein